ncbi:MAG TPA: ChbG/HpnK family deacetylase [Caulobacteraceae bacterium]|nr:ChbG/HpnK family deacetylase [Caulobacteraceae bacterium]
MDTDRRALVQGLGAGLSAGALGLGLSAAGSSALAQPARPPKAGRKMIVRADDVGHSKVCNIGTFDAIDHGVVTTVAIMLDSPGTEDALERLRAYPWLPLDWHMHMWGAPVLGAARTPSLVEHGGPFDGRFRMDLARAPDVSFEEAVAELRAQLERCIKIVGRAPDTRGGSDDGTSPWARAITQVGAEYGIVYNFAGSPPTDPVYQKHINDAQKAGEEWAKYYPAKPSPAVAADARWAGRKIYNLGGTTAYIDLLTDSISSVEKNYDAVKFYTEDRSGILKTPADWVTMQAWHPGYVDYYVYRLGERVNRARAQQFVVGRTQDVAALSDPRLRAWIKANGIELVSTRDALYGTREIQNRLETIGSDLAFA